MDGNSENKVICCFCGKELFIENAVVLTIQSNIQSEECQQLFCHKNHLIERIDKSIPIYLDFGD
jgi:hypothetical protein